MSNISLIFAAVLMIFNFCGSALAEDAPAREPSATELRSPAAAETPLPEAASDPTPEPAPETPTPTAAAQDEPDTAGPESPESSDSPAAAAKSPKPGSIFDLIAGGAAQAEPAYQVDMAAYYLGDMTAAAAEGDVEAGRTAEQNRNAAIDASGGDTQKIAFDDLYLLARVISSEAGSDWLSEDFRICVGEVVLNRVASPEYPDTIYDVVYQKGQYTGVNTVRFANMKPSEDCVNAALKLLQGERRMVPAVVYQSDCIQGELFSMYSDRRLGNTYFCLSPNLELYD